MTLKLPLHSRPLNLCRADIVVLQWRPGPDLTDEGTPYLAEVYMQKIMVVAAARPTRWKYCFDMRHWHFPTSFGRKYTFSPTCIHTCIAIPNVLQAHIHTRDSYMDSYPDALLILHLNMEMEVVVVCVYVCFGMMCVPRIIPLSHIAVYILNYIFEDIN